MVFMRQAQIRQKGRGQKAQRAKAEAFGLPQAQAARERRQGRGQNRLEEGRRVADARFRRRAERLRRDGFFAPSGFPRRGVFIGRRDKFSRPIRFLQMGVPVFAVLRNVVPSFPAFPQAQGTPFLVA